jgi:hypothetical protein
MDLSPITKRTGELIFINPVVASTSMSELSLAAQEVFWAFNKAASGEPDDWHYLPAVAAALRAAADQVVPANGSRKNNEIRAEFLAIADELEAS